MHLFRKIRRIAVRTVLGLLALAALGLAGVNGYLLTEAGKRRVAHRLGLVIGCPVRLGSASLSPTGTLTARALSLGSPDVGGPPGPSLEIDSANARLALWALLAGQIRWREVASDGVRLRLVDRPPAPREEPPLAVDPELAGDEPERPVPSAPDAVSPEGTLGAAPAPPAPPRRWHLERFRFERVEIVVCASDGVTERLRVEGIAGEGTSEEGGPMTGTLEFATCRGPGGLVATAGRAALMVDEGILKVSSARAECGGGQLRGGVVLRFGAPGAPFRAAVSASGIDPAAVLSAFGELPARVAEGAIEGDGLAEGWLRAPGHTRSRLSVRLRGGILALDPGIRAGEALGADADGRVPVDRAEAVVLLLGHRGVLQEAAFQAGPLLLKSNGFLESGGLRLSLRAYLGWGRGSGPAIAATGLPPFSRWDGTDWHYLDFSVGGTVRGPLIAPTGGREWLPLPDFLRGLGAGHACAGAEPDMVLGPVSRRGTE